MVLVQGRPEVAARLFGASVRARDRVGVAVWPSMIPLAEALRAVVVAAIGPAAFDLAVSAGARLALPAAFTLGLAAAADGPAAPGFALADRPAGEDLDHLPWWSRSPAENAARAGRPVR